MTIKTGHSVVYPGQGDPQGFGPEAGIGPQPAFPGEAGFGGGQAGVGRQRPRRKLGGAGLFWAVVWVIFMVGGIFATAVTVTIPSSALWMSGIVCSSPYQLTYNTSHYSYKPGQSGTAVGFQCVSGASSYHVNEFAIIGLQFLLAALVMCGGLAVFGLMWRLLRKPR